jgi:hypothetical protein
MRTMEHDCLGTLRANHFNDFGQPTFLNHVTVASVQSILITTLKSPLPSPKNIFATTHPHTHTRQPLEHRPIPKPQPGKSSHTPAMVENAVSSTATPDEPSFLALPAELRNLVYSFLFKNKGRTLLHNARAWPYSDVPCE